MPEPAKRLSNHQRERAFELFFNRLLGIVHQIQEYSRYTHSDFAGVVRGIGNRRGEVAKDPCGAIEEAERMGQELFVRKVSDYRIDTERAGGVW